MARKTDKQIMAELLDTHSTKMRLAFMAIIADIKDKATIKVLLEYVKAGNIERAIQSLNIEAEAFNDLQMELTEAYNAGGVNTVDQLPSIREPDGSKAVFRFSIRSPEAEVWLRTESSTLITRIVEDSKEVVRATLADSLAKGDNPRRTIGRLIGHKVGPRREGGVLGLTSPQEQFVRNARQQLAEGDAGYFTRQRRDVRFDRMIRKAFKEGRPLTLAQIDRITGRYADRLLQLRGESVAMNETMNALAAGRHEGVNQQVLSGKLDPRDIEKVWRHTPQEHPRLDHVAMDGKKAKWGEPFVLPDGTRMNHPHSADAPAKQKVFCKCFYGIRVDHLAAIARRENG